MSSGLVTVKCSNCHRETEIIPGTIVAECDHCGRLFRPAEGEGAPSTSSTSSSTSSTSSSTSSTSSTFTFGTQDSSPASSNPDRPPWESGSDELKPAISAAAARREEEAQHQRDLVDIRKLSHGQGATVPVDYPEEEEPARRETTPTPVRRPGRPATPQGPASTSAAPAVFIFITLLVMAIGAYVMARKEESSSRPKKEEPGRRTRDHRPARRAPGTVPGEPNVAKTTDTTAPANGPSMNLTAPQRIGMDHVEKFSVVLSAEQLENVRKVVTHRAAHPFHFWGAKEPKLEVVVFAPFTHMGIARLKQLNREFKKLEPFEDRIAVWFVFHWGADQGLEAEAATLANAIHWTYKPEGMYHFVNLLQKEATWRVASLGKLDEYVRTVGLDPVKLRASLETLPMEDVRREVSGLMADLHLPDKDLTFLIGGRSYLEGKTLYHVARIVDYELAAREP